MRRQKKIIFIGALTVAVAVLLLVLAVLTNKRTLEFNVADGDTVHVEYSKDSHNPGVTATYRDSFFFRRGVDVEVTTQGDVDYSKLGTYTVKCTATHKGITKEITVTLLIEDTTAPQIELVTNPEYYTKPNETYIEEGYTAIDEHDGDLTANVIREERDGVVYYTVTDSAGNTATVERQIVYKDTVAPTITLAGDQNMKVNLGGTYEEPGYTATDDCQGDITASVIIEGSVDASKEGSYELRYYVEDDYGNSYEIIRVVTVSDIEGPSILLNGDTIMYVKVGESYSEPGYSASDNLDGDVTGKVVVTSHVDTSKKGVYSVVYKVTDTSGNTTETTRKIYVYEKQMVAETVDPGDKVVYLTFDDGPGRYTERLLDILDKYGVKVTFFVTNQFPKYKDMIGEAHRRGHTIALHTYSHQYSIYSSEEAYYEDLGKIRDLVVDQTGVEPKIVRFPGGTSNTISRSYCKGIMTKLTKSLAYHGYLYCDWNVSSGDAGGTTNTSEVAANVISGIKKHDVSIVLQHDIHKYSVDAVEEIIAWGLANGYVFLPMDETTPMYQQKPNN